MQVVIRQGKHINAVPPDYRLLDYNPDTHQYLHATMRLSNDSFRESQAGMGPARASLSGANGLGEPASYPRIADSRNGVVRGLSIVLSSEAQSVPDGGARRRTVRPCPPTPAPPPATAWISTARGAALECCWMMLHAKRLPLDVWSIDLHRSLVCAGARQH